MWICHAACSPWSDGDRPTACCTDGMWLTVKGEFRARTVLRADIAQILLMTARPSNAGGAWLHTTMSDRRDPSCQRGLTMQFLEQVAWWPVTWQRTRRAACPARHMGAGMPRAGWSARCAVLQTGLARQRSTAARAGRPQRALRCAAPRWMSGDSEELQVDLRVHWPANTGSRSRALFRWLGGPVLIYRRPGQALFDKPQHVTCRGGLGKAALSLPAQYLCEGRSTVVFREEGQDR